MDETAQPRSSTDIAQATSLSPDAISNTRADPGSNSSPDRPYSIFTTTQKRAIVLAASVTAFFSPMSAQIYFPALPALASDFHVSDDKINLTITTYMIFQGLTPMFIGTLADSAGRRPAYIICFVIYIAACIGLALSQNYASLLIVRCLQSAGSSSTVALCSAVVADVVTSGERGEYVIYTVIPIVLAPAIGPVVGGALAQYLGWRSIFWFLTILAGVCLVFLALFFPETNRRLVGDGSVRPPTLYVTLWRLLRERSQVKKSNKDATTSAEFEHEISGNSASIEAGHRLSFRDLNPLGTILLLFQPSNFLVLAYGSIVMSGFYTLAAAMPSLFNRLYGYNELVIGLLYLPIAAGSIISAPIVGPLMNWNYRRHCKLAGVPFDRSRQQDLRNVPVERARLEVGIPLILLTSVGLIAWGWSVQVRAHVAVPCVLLFIMGVGMIGFNNTVNALIIDINRTQAGTAMAASNLTRCLVGAGASYAILPLIAAMGIGWAFTFLALLFVFFSPMLLFLMKYGMQWRQKKAKRSGQPDAMPDCPTQKEGQV